VGIKQIASKDSRFGEYPALAGCETSPRSFCNMQVNENRLVVLPAALRPFGKGLAH
jgi:hypothetical protein